MTQPSLSEIYSGTYTPIVSNVANVASVTAKECQFQKVGNVITVSGQVDITPTTGTTTLTQLSISLPYATDLTTTWQCSGTAIDSQYTNTAGKIRGATIADVAYLEFYAKETTSRTWYFIFQYRLT